MLLIKAFSPALQCILDLKDSNVIFVACVLTTLKDRIIHVHMVISLMPQEKTCFKIIQLCQNT